VRGKTGEDLHSLLAFERAVARCTPLVPFVPFVFLWQIAFAFLRTNTGTCPYGSCFRLFLWRIAFIRIYLWLLLASDRNRLASVRILSISIFIRTMPSQCV